MNRLHSLLAHPGATSLLFPLAAALQEIDSRTEFHTSLYFDLAGKLGRALQHMPRFLADPLRRQLGRRYRPDIDARHVHRHPWGEIAYLLARRTGMIEAGRAMRWRNDRFDAAIARELARAAPRNFIGFDGSSLQSIRAARRAGISSILIQAIGHIDALIEIMREERRRWPAFFGADEPATPASWLDRQRAEAIEADIVAVPSPYVANTLIARGTPPDRLRLIPYPCDLARFAPAERAQPAMGKEPLRALFVGAIGPRKGIPYLLEAAAPLVRSGQMTLDLVGPLDCPPAALAPWRDVFQMRSGLAPTEMPALYGRADVLVLPSLHEGQAMVCNEAMACGVPVICTPNAGSTLRDGTEGFVVPVRDSAAISAALHALIDDPEQRHRMGIAARRHAEHHDVARFIQSLRAILAD